MIWEIIRFILLISLTLMIYDGVKWCVSKLTHKKPKAKVK